MRDTSGFLQELFAEFADRVADVVVTRLAATSDSTSQRDELVDEPTMADLSKVSQQSLQRRRKAGEIPFVQCGRRVLYRQADVIDALTSKKKGGDA